MNVFYQDHFTSEFDGVTSSMTSQDDEITDKQKSSWRGSAEVDRAWFDEFTAG